MLLDIISALLAVASVLWFAIATYITSKALEKTDSPDQVARGNTSLVLQCIFLMLLSIYTGAIL